mmetsp:Transcript_113727/g.367999  ORF Transcript_113727/g.367999 Transcript_113727/m.367999 type:complete len:162 (+) Transcript_113727:84-569(+)
MCSEGNSAAASKVAVVAMEMAGLADAEGRAQQWRQARAELEDVDRAVEDLQEELRRFQMRRKVLAEREAALRAGAGQVEADQEKKQAAAEPRFFSLAEDDAERSPCSTEGDAEDRGSSTSSMEDWEVGLEALNSMGSRDRGANLRAHMLMASTKKPPVRRR